MRRRDDDRLAEALRGAPVPGEIQAEDRAWTVVHEAFVEREPVAIGSRSRRRFGLALAGAAIGATLALTPAGADVREWIANVISPGEEDARPLLGSLPTSGSLLVESGAGVWIQDDDGTGRRLGDYSHATWSPNGLYVGASEGRELVALTPQGEVRWRLAAPARIRALDWSTDEGFRIGYVAGDQLRVVAGDGTADTTLVASIGAPAIAWRPESSPARARHQLAYVASPSRVVLLNTDTRRVVWRSADYGAEIESLQWSADGRRLLVAGDGFATVLSADGRPLLKGVAAGASAATLAPDGEHVATVRPGARGGAELALLPTEVGERESILYPGTPASSGSFGTPSFSPDGRWILLPWPAADQWLFVSVDARRVVAVADISRQFDTDRRGSAPFPRVAGWCC